MTRCLRTCTFFVLALSILWDTPSTSAMPVGRPNEVIDDLLSIADSELHYEHAKFALDYIVDPDTSEADIIEQVNQIAEAASRISAGGNDIDKLKAVRQVLYDAGAWNGGKPFTYDRADPYGADLRNKLLNTYLHTRQGNCVSMPILHLIVGEKLGLNVSLSTAPLHLFVRYTNANNGHSLAIETTSGGYPTRDAWYHEKMGVTDTQVSNGIYLGVLTKRETIAVMASTVTEWLMSEGRWQDAIDVADVLLEYYPKDIHALLARGSAYGQLLQMEFTDKYPTPDVIPASLKPRYRMLATQNAAAFQQAEAWGWTPIDP